MNPYPRDPYHEEARRKAGLFRAGEAAIWVWVALAALPIICVILCCVFCGWSSIVGGIMNGVHPTPTPTY